MLNFPRDLLLGRWTRNQATSDGNMLIEFAVFNLDGSFEISFTTVSADNHVLEHIVELGDWGLVGDIHFTFTKSEVIGDQMYAADLSEQDNYHAYQVLMLDQDCFQYRHIVSQETFILKRVIDNIGHC